MIELRVLDDEPQRGAWNMAVDQAILDHVDVHSESILRWYAWAPATLSLGYFQRFGDRDTHAASRPLDIVRRASGGGAIVHDQELTYSLTVPIASRWSADNRGLYELVHLSVIEFLSELGIESKMYLDDKKTDGTPFLCFQRRAAGDLVVGEWKIGGSAQRRSKKSLLQHGSLLLRRSRFAPELPGIEDLWGQTVDRKQMKQRITTLIARRLSLPFRQTEISNWLVESAQEISVVKFANDRWTQNR